MLRRRVVGVVGGSAAATAACLQWTRWTSSLPTSEPPPGSLLAATGASSTAVCAALPARSLGWRPHAGSNNRPIDESLLLSALDALQSACLPGSGFEAAVAVTPFGAELWSTSPPLWLAASAREPRWVGDDQLVVLWAGHPQPTTPAALDAVRLRLLMDTGLRAVQEGAS